MTAPNNIQISTIYAGVATTTATTGQTTLISNSSGSNQVWKIEMVMATNIGTATTDITLYLVRANNAVSPPLSSAGTYSVYNAATVPTKSVMTLVSKDIPVNLQEGDSLQILASANSSIQVTCSYQILG